MAISQVFLSDSKSGRCSSTSEMRLFRFYEAKNIGRRAYGCLHTPPRR
ncbi:unnamed protein product [Brassica rapa subsp. trilocularis]